MKNLQLDFTQRFKLMNLLSQQEGTLGKTAPFMRVLEKVRFTDAEDPQIVRTRISETQISFTPPSPDFGRITVDIETADAAAVLELMESWPRFTTADHGWAAPLIGALK